MAPSHLLSKELSVILGQIRAGITLVSSLAAFVQEREFQFFVGQLLDQQCLKQKWRTHSIALELTLIISCFSRWGGPQGSKSPPK